MPDPEIELERVYTVPLSRAWIAPRHRRVVRAVNMLREFAEHHMKSEEIKIDWELNETLWKRGITKPPRRITVKMTKDEDGLVTISLPKAAEEEVEAEGEVKAEEAKSAPQEALKEVPVKEEKQEGKPVQAEAMKETKNETKPQKKASAKKGASKKASGEKKSAKKPKSSKKK